MWYPHLGMHTGTYMRTSPTTRLCILLRCTHLASLKNPYKRQVLSDPLTSLAVNTSMATSLLSHKNSHSLTFMFLPTRLVLMFYISTVQVFAKERVLPGGTPTSFVDGMYVHTYVTQVTEPNSSSLTAS